MMIMIVMMLISIVMMVKRFWGDYKKKGAINEFTHI